MGWSDSENRQLMDHVNEHGCNNWALIAKHLGRTDKVCQHHYYHKLHPGLNPDPITEEEGKEIERLASKIGHEWAEIGRRLGHRSVLGHRSGSAVQNWWHKRHGRPKRPDRAAQTVSLLDDYLRASRTARSLPAAESPCSQAAIFSSDSDFGSHATRSVATLGTSVDYLHQNAENGDSSDPQLLIPPALNQSRLPGGPSSPIQRQDQGLLRSQQHSKPTPENIADGKGPMRVAFLLC